MKHVSDHQIARYYRGEMGDEEDQASLEQHLLACVECLDRAEKSADCMDTAPVYRR